MHRFFVIRDSRQFPACRNRTEDGHVYNVRGVANPFTCTIYDHTMIQRTKELRSLVYETAASATEVVTVATNLVLDESHRADPTEDHLSRERLARDAI